MNIIDDSKTIGTLIAEYLIDAKDKVIQQNIKLNAPRSSNNNSIFKSAVDQYIKERLFDVAYQYVRKVRRQNPEYRKTPMLVQLNVEIVTADINKVDSYQCRPSATVKPVTLV